MLLVSITDLIWASPNTSNRHYLEVFLFFLFFFFFILLFLYKLGDLKWLYLIFFFNFSFFTYLII